ncbi:hypothetical protein SV7mr_26580 [Stieleria bergensis]|uniref:Uncharacterized protein n=1 Tax=Stieleria bergensis TaxID=2528025 RepID=A0A517SVK1_9BACT|nr:hypothetical protein SV7mr_26580 [Planctomycetes bacterium SV_7m_r]
MTGSLTESWRELIITFRYQHAEPKCSLNDATPRNVRDESEKPNAAKMESVRQKARIRIHHAVIPDDWVVQTEAESPPTSALPQQAIEQ